MISASSAALVPGLNPTCTSRHNPSLLRYELQSLTKKKCQGCAPVQSASECNGLLVVQVRDESVETGYTSCQFHPDGLILGTGTQGSMVHIWEVRQQKVTFRTLRFGSSVGVQQLSGCLHTTESHSLLKPACFSYSIGMPAWLRDSHQHPDKALWSLSCLLSSCCSMISG